MRRFIHEKAAFIEPMLLLRQDALPADATRWLYQLKLSYRAIADLFRGEALSALLITLPMFLILDAYYLAQDGA